MSRNFGLHNDALYERRMSRHKAKTLLYRAKLVLCTIMALAVAVIVMALISALFAKDDGRFADSPLKPWFDSLASKKGLCCSFADGRTVDDPDIDMDGAHYRVRIDGHWIGVPDEAIIEKPNRYGRAVVWPYTDAAGTIQIRCFMPGAGT